MQANVLTLPVSLEQVAALIKRMRSARPATVVSNGSGVGH